MKDSAVGWNPFLSSVSHPFSRPATDTSCSTALLSLTMCVQSKVFDPCRYIPDAQHPHFDEWRPFLNSHSRSLQTRGQSISVRSSAITAAVLQRLTALFSLFYPQ